MKYWQSSWLGFTKNGTNSTDAVKMETFTHAKGNPNICSYNNIVL
jgi:hypothetical protein